MKKYIKVTLCGQDNSLVLDASLEAFYRSQKATIEEPTNDEIVKFFPEEATRVKNADIAPLNGPSVAKGFMSEIARLKGEIARLKAENDRLNEENKRLAIQHDADVASLNEAESLMNALREKKKGATKKSK